MKTAILINDTSKECHLGCIEVINNINKICKTHNITVTATLTREDIINKPAHYLNFLIDNCNYVLINGEGSLHHHPTKTTQWFKTLLTMLPRKGKKVILFNTLWQNMNDFPNLEKELDKIDLISVRETVSYNDLISIYPKKEKILITPDMIFASDYKLAPLGYGDSVLVSVKKSLKKESNYFPLAFIGSGSALHPIGYNLPKMEAYLNWLQSLEIYVTGRFHGVCLASIAGVPFLVFKSNSHKIEGILYDMGCQPLLIQDIKQVTGKTGTAKKLAPKAHQYALDAKPKIENLFKRITEL